MQNLIKDIIHDIATNKAGIYSCLYFGENEKLIDFNFAFSFNKTDNEDSIKEDVLFFIDNIISKTFELNYNIDYTKTKRLGGTITVNNQTTKNHFIIYDYIISDDYFKISDIENYLDDIIVKDIGSRYIIEWKLPIYKIDKDKIEES